MIAWLARLIGIAGGKLEPNDYEKLEAAINGKIGEKLRTFWKTWLERESFKKTWILRQISWFLADVQHFNMA